MKHLFSGHRCRRLPRILLAVGLAIPPWLAQATPLTGNPTECAVPNRDIQVQGNTLTVTYTFPQISEVTFTQDSTSSPVVRHAIPGFGQCNETGRPMLPMRLDSFRIPDGYTVSLSVSDSEDSTVVCDYAAVGEPETDSDSIPSPIPVITPYEGLYPAANASLLSTYCLRGDSIAEINVSPIRYDYVSHKAYISPSVTYQLTFNLADNPFSLQKAPTRELLSLEEMLENSLVVNMNEIGDISSTDKEGFEGTVDYLIVTTDELKEVVENSIARWKKLLGYTTHIISRESWSSPIEVRNAVIEARNMYENVQYLLIVGDHQDVPAMALNNFDPHVTDNYFGTLDNRAYVPDIYIGRIPVSSEDEANYVLNKLIRSEMCPVDDANFYSNAIHCAAFDYKNNSAGKVEARRFILTSQEIRDYVATHGITAHRFYRAPSDADPKYYNDDIYAFGQAMPVELQRPNFDWDCYSASIVAQFHSGALYALYRGHGSVDGWEQVGLRSKFLDFMINDDLCSTVFSITCNTGKFDENCFAEKLIRKPEGGARCVIAASAPSYSGYNDSFAEGIIDAIWPDPGIVPRFGRSGIGAVTPTPAPTYRLGQIKEQGLYRMKEQYGTIDPAKVKYQYEVFNLFGDPSMMFNTAVPTAFNRVQIKRRDNEIYVNTFGEKASISFYNEETDEAYRYETDEISFPTSDPKNTIVCITGHNRLTFLSGVITPTDDPVLNRPSILNCTTNNSTATIKLATSESSDNIELNISDISGLYHQSSVLEAGDCIREIQVPLPEARGIYIVTLKQDGTIIETKKIVK